MQPMQHTLQHTVHMHAYVTGVPGRGPAVRDLGDRRHLLVGEQAPDEQRVLRDLAHVRKHVGGLGLAQLAHDLGRRSRCVRIAARFA